MAATTEKVNTGPGFRVRSFRDSFRMSMGTFTREWREFEPGELSEDELAELSTEPLIVLEPIGLSAAISEMHLADDE